MKEWDAILIIQECRAIFRMYTLDVCQQGRQIKKVYYDASFQYLFFPFLFYFIFFFLLILNEMGRVSIILKPIYYCLSNSMHICLHLLTREKIK